MKELHQTRMDLKLKTVDLQEAQVIYDEWFSEVDETEPVKATPRKK